MKTLLKIGKVDSEKLADITEAVNKTRKTSNEAEDKFRRSIEEAKYNLNRVPIAGAFTWRNKDGI